MATAETKLREIHAAYPQWLREHEGIERPLFHVELVLRKLGRTPAAVVDIGGGLGPVAPSFAALGARAVLLDDLGDAVNLEHGDAPLAVHRSQGVEIVNRDALDADLTDYGPFDAIMSFDSMEHWHHSPKRLFHSAVEALTPAGVFLLSTPNCVNLRKRVAVPLGRSKWSPMGEWYEVETFRGHVREPDVDDYRYIARDLGLIDVEIFGRNWLGYSGGTARRILTRLIDRPLRLRPTLCSDIYLLGRKPS